MSINYDSQAIRTHMLEGKFGLEKESLRVNEKGYLAHTKHPFPDDPRMDRDFCENQVELITRPHDSLDGMYEELSCLHKTAVVALQHLETGREVLWPFSNPPYVRGEDDIPIAMFEGELKKKEDYRRYLASKYGKRKMLFSGIHFNFSFAEEIFQIGYQAQLEDISYEQYKSEIYLNLAKKVTQYSWLIVYLTAASPMIDGSFLHDDQMGQDVVKNYASPRCSEIGYWNHFVPILDYTNLDTYVESIESYVREGKLRAASELYYPVRLKPAGENSLQNLKKSGVNHIEIRTLDLNPLSIVGIKKEDLQFLHLLLIYLTSLPDSGFDALEQMNSIRNEQEAAKYDNRSIWIEHGWNYAMSSIQDATLEVLSDMQAFFEHVNHAELVPVIEYQSQKIYYPEERYAVQIRQRFKQHYVQKGLELAQDYAREIEKQLQRQAKQN